MSYQDRNLGNEGTQSKEILIEPGGTRDDRDSGGSQRDDGETTDINTDNETEFTDDIDADNTDTDNIEPEMVSDLSSPQDTPPAPVPQPSPPRSSTSSILRCCGLFDRPTWPSLIAFWILGLCNNFGYVVMLSAAHDIIKEHSQADDTPKNERDCNTMSTGAILLADVVPSLCIKMFVAFLPLCIKVRVVAIVILSIMGYVIVAASTIRPLIFVGVACTSLASGLGEASFVAYMSFFRDKGVIGFWSSGTGAAGLAGAMGYAAPTSLGISPPAVLYSMTAVPIIMAFIFTFVLQHPDGPIEREVTQEERPQFLLKEKFSYLPKLFKYMVPIGLVYLFEYLINQGLFELLYYKDTFLTHDEQYRWYQVLYQLGVVISRSSIGLVTINNLSLLAILQGLNLILLFTETIYFFMPHMLLVMLIIVWEGLLGGASYVNTLYKMNIEVVEDKREFAMGVVTLSDSIGITMAGILSIPLHNFICELPKY
ncbi:battenin isoform X2 [Nilaparvata lugens]|nr:battenin isoform X2 [Nilaparvata lugens]